MPSVDRLKDPGRAVPLLEQAAALAPEDTMRRQLAASLNAALHAARLVRHPPPKDRALAHYELARVLAPNDRARASAELDLALRIDPGHPDAPLEALEHFEKKHEPELDKRRASSASQGRARQASQTRS